MSTSVNDAVAFITAGGDVKGLATLDEICNGASSAAAILKKARDPYPGEERWRRIEVLVGSKRVVRVASSTCLEGKRSRVKC